MFAAPTAEDAVLEEEEPVVEELSARRERMSKSKDPVVPLTQQVELITPPHGRQHHLPSGQGLRA